MGKVPWNVVERSLETGEVPVERDVAVTVWLRDAITLPFTAHLWLKSGHDEAFALVGTLTQDVARLDILLKQGTARLMVSLAARGLGSCSPSGKATARTTTVAGQVN